MFSRKSVEAFVRSKLFRRTIITLICINAIALGLETNQPIMEKYGFWIHTLDAFILTVFVGEMVLKIHALRKGFFKSGWNVFDFIVISISLVPDSGIFSVFRSLRVLKALRLMSTVPAMRKVISAIGGSIPGMSSIIGVLALLFYVFSVMATKLFGQHPDPQMQEWFGTLASSAFTLFQIMTLESWSMGIVRPVMEYYPWAWQFFIPFIFVTSFAVLNLFIGIIVDALQTIHEQEIAESKQEMRNVADSCIEEIKGSLKELADEVRALKSKVKE